MTSGRVWKQLIRSRRGVVMRRGPGRVWLVMLEEVGDYLDSREKIQVVETLKRLLRTTQRRGAANSRAEILQSDSA